MNQNQEYSKAINYIQELIHEGKLEEGSKLPTERALAEEIGISRNSTREALSILKGMGIVNVRQGSGNYISDGFGGRMSQILNIMMSLGTISLEDICQFRRTMEKAICAYLIEEGIDEETHNILGNLVRRMEVEDNLSHIDREFHYQLIKATDNRLIEVIMDAVIEVYGSFIDIVLNNADKEKQSRLMDYHYDMYHGLITGNSSEVIDAIDGHYNLIEESIQ